MTVVSGSLSLVTSHPAEVSQVWVRARDTRTNGVDVVVADNAHIEVKNGAVRMELLPGPAIMVLTHHGRTTRTIPLMVTGTTQTLAQAVELGQATDGKTAGELQSLLDRIASEVAGATDGSVGEAKRAEEGAKKSAADAQRSAGEAKASAESVAGAVAGVSAHAGAAEGAAESARASADGAAGSADAAKVSAENASKSATAAQTSETNAKGHASEAAKHEVAAKGHADDAAASAARAGEIADSTSWDGDKLTVNGKTSPSLRGPKGDPGDKGEPGPPGEGGAITGVIINDADESSLSVDGKYSMVVGPVGQVKGDQSAAIGSGSVIGNTSMALGNDAMVEGTNSTAVGMGGVQGDFSVGVGADFGVKGDRATAVGAGAQAQGESATAVGPHAQATDDKTTAIGIGCRAEFPLSTAIGVGLTVNDLAQTHIGVSQGAIRELQEARGYGNLRSTVVLHSAAVTSQPASRPEHLINKGYVDVVKADVETKATVKMVSAPPSVFEPNVLYVIPEDKGGA